MTDFAVVGGQDPASALKRREGAVGGGPQRNAIIAERARNGPYESIWDFAERVDQSASNKRVLEALVKCRRRFARLARMGMPPGARAGGRLGDRSSRQTGSPAKGRSSTSVQSRDEKAESTTPPVPTEEFDRRPTC